MLILTPFSRYHQIATHHFRIGETRPCGRESQRSSGYLVGLRFSFSSVSPDWPTGRKNCVRRLRSNWAARFLFFVYRFFNIKFSEQLRVVTETDRTFTCEILMQGAQQAAFANGPEISFRSVGSFAACCCALQLPDSCAAALATDVDYPVACPSGRFVRGCLTVTGFNRLDRANLLEITSEPRGARCKRLSVCTPAAKIGPLLASNGG